MIEKTIALQMAQHIKMGCDHFTVSVAENRSKQLAKSHLFFSVKRDNRESPAGTMSPSFKAFSSCDTETFDKRYREHFKSFRA